MRSARVIEEDQHPSLPDTLTAAELLGELTEEGISLEIRGEPTGLFLRDLAGEKLSPEAAEEARERFGARIRRERVQIIALLLYEGASREERELWPRECFLSEARFGHGGARLYPLVGKTVGTSRGEGRLAGVLCGEAKVVLPTGADRSAMVAIPLDEVRPSRALRRRPGKNRGGGRESLQGSHRGGPHRGRVARARDPSRPAAG